MKHDWEPGYYQPTEKFLAIPEHRAIMRSSDQGLVAVCGPAHDPESDEAARLIAAAPQMFEALEMALGSETSEDCEPDHHGYCQAHGLDPIDECWVKKAEQALAAAGGGEEAPAGAGSEQ